MKKDLPPRDRALSAQSLTLTTVGRRLISSGYPTKSEIARTLAAADCNPDLEVEGFEIDRRGRIKVFLKAIAPKPDNSFDEWQRQRDMKSK